MPSVKKRGDSFRIMVSLGYGMDGRQIRKTTTYTPPEGVTPGKAEKLATAFAYPLLNSNMKKYTWMAFFLYRSSSVGTRKRHRFYYVLLGYLLRGQIR